MLHPIAMAAGIVALGAACGSSGSTGSGGGAGSGSGAGRLDTPFTAEIQAFKKQNPGVTVHSQFGGSADMIRASPSSASRTACWGQRTTR